VIQTCQSTRVVGRSSRAARDLASVREADHRQGNEDAALVERVRQRDQHALASLYDRHGVTVYAIALSILHDPGQAEDVTQEVFLTLWTQPERFDPDRGRFAPWCYRITRNRAIDVIRQRRRELQPAQPAVFELMLGAAVDAPAEEVVLRAEAERVRAALWQLAAEQRRVLELAYFRGMSQSQMAAELGIPLGTIKTRVRTALLRLREILEDDQPASSRTA
jgi:RNA polymerase sigma-70 factor (ECF subfamily)